MRLLSPLRLDAGIPGVLWTRVRSGQRDSPPRSPGTSEHAAAAGAAGWTRRGQPARLRPQRRRFCRLHRPHRRAPAPRPPARASAPCPRNTLLKAQHQEPAFTTGPAHLIIVSLLDKKRFSIISQLHVQIHRFPIDFYVDLKENTLVHSGKPLGGGAAGTRPHTRSL